MNTICPAKSFGNTLIGAIIILGIFLLLMQSCKIGNFHVGDYVQGENEYQCVCQITEVYPKKKKMDVVCQIGDSLVVAKKSNAKSWYKCSADKEFKVK